MTYSNKIFSCPSSHRFLEFLNGILNRVSPSSPLDEFSELIDEYIKFIERVDFVYTVLTANPETLPVKALEPLSEIVFI